MSDTPIAKNEFLAEVNAILDQNIANEHFGVSELADAMNMSRSNLLRKVKKETKLSVAQLISQVRLNRAMELLKSSTLNVSEVSYQVGFNSPSYFIKCFRERYGYPPGEAGKRTSEEMPESTPVRRSASDRRKVIFISIAAAILVSVGIAWFAVRPGIAGAADKSIVVLPFKNESSDSSNIYLINGLMDATLNNLQRMKQLRVISRTSAEKYRNSDKSIPEIASELGVNYFVEGSGQKIGDRIVLNIQLIDAATDKHLWSKQYRRESKEIFELQEEIARNIASEIQVFISPEESLRLGKKPTDNLAAYDAFLKGRDLFYQGTAETQLAAIPWFETAVQVDPEFSLAYAHLSIIYYYLDVFRIDKKYAMEISTNADKAMLFDPKSDMSLVAKALDYANKQQFNQAALFFEKALEYNPNSGLVRYFLNEFYSMHTPNPAKHLENALRKVKVDPMVDSSLKAFDYFHLSNALFETGFIDEAITYINKSYDFNPRGFFTGYFRAQLVNLKDNNLPRTREMLLTELNRDSNNFVIVQEVAKASFLMRDYDESFKYYSRFVMMREMMHINLLKSEDLRIAIVYQKAGMKSEAQKFVASFKDFADNDLTVYKHLYQSMYWSYMGDNRKALDHLKLFAGEQAVRYPDLRLADDPIFERVSALPEFKATMSEIRSAFEKTHTRLAAMLEEEQLP